MQYDGVVSRGSVAVVSFHPLAAVNPGLVHAVKRKNSFFYNCIVLGSLSLGKASCDRVALPNLRCMLFQCFHKTPIHTEPRFVVSSEGLWWGIQSAQNLDSDFGGVYTDCTEFELRLCWGIHRLHRIWTPAKLAHSRCA